MSEEPVPPADFRLLSIGQYYIERYYARGAARELPPTAIQKMRTLMSRRAGF